MKTNVLAEPTVPAPPVLPTATLRFQSPALCKTGVKNKWVFAVLPLGRTGVKNRRFLKTNVLAEPTVPAPPVLPTATLRFQSPSLIRVKDLRLTNQRFVMKNLWVFLKNRRFSRFLK